MFIEAREVELSSDEEADRAHGFKGYVVVRISSGSRTPSAVSHSTFTQNVLGVLAYKSLL
jgi:hypothetical protein